MTPHEANVRETREWFGKAAEDLASARVLIGSNHFVGALFFCQQTAEKSLRIPEVIQGFGADEENDLTQIREKCRAGFSLRRALARPRRVEIGSLLFP